MSEEKPSSTTILGTSTMRWSLIPLLHLLLLVSLTEPLLVSAGSRRLEKAGRIFGLSRIRNADQYFGQSQVANVVRSLGSTQFAKRSKSSLRIPSKDYRKIAENHPYTYTLNANQEYERVPVPSGTTKNPDLGKTRIEADHILEYQTVEKHVTKYLKDYTHFNDLPDVVKDDIRKIVNNANNLAPIPKSINASKGSKLGNAWMGRSRKSQNKQSESYMALVYPDALRNAKAIDKVFADRGIKTKQTLETTLQQTHEQYDFVITNGKATPPGPVTKPSQAGKRKTPPTNASQGGAKRPRQNVQAPVQAAQAPASNTPSTPQPQLNGASPMSSVSRQTNAMSSSKGAASPRKLGVNGVSATGGAPSKGASASPKAAGTRGSIGKGVSKAASRVKAIPNSSSQSLFRAQSRPPTLSPTRGRSQTAAKKTSNSKVSSQKTKQKSGSRATGSSHQAPNTRPNRKTTAARTPQVGPICPRSRDSCFRSIANANPARTSPSNRQSKVRNTSKSQALSQSKKVNTSLPSKKTSSTTGISSLRKSMVPNSKRKSTVPRVSAKSIQGSSSKGKGVTKPSSKTPSASPRAKATARSSSRSSSKAQSNSPTRSPARGKSQVQAKAASPKSMSPLQSKQKANAKATSSPRKSLQTNKKTTAPRTPRTGVSQGSKVTTTRRKANLSAPARSSRQSVKGTNPNSKPSLQLKKGAKAQLRAPSQSRKATNRAPASPRKPNSLFSNKKPSSPRTLAKGTSVKGKSSPKPASKVSPASSKVKAGPRSSSRSPARAPSRAPAQSLPKGGKQPQSKKGAIPKAKVASRQPSKQKPAIKPKAPSRQSPQPNKKIPAARAPQAGVKAKGSKTPVKPAARSPSPQQKAPKPASKAPPASSKAKNTPRPPSKPSPKVQPPAKARPQPKVANKTPAKTPPRPNVPKKKA